MVWSMIGLGALWERPKWSLWRTIIRISHAICDKNTIQKSQMRWNCAYKTTNATQSLRNEAIFFTSIQTCQKPSSSKARTSTAAIRKVKKSTSGLPQSSEKKYSWWRPRRKEWWWWTSQGLHRFKMKTGDWTSLQMLQFMLLTRRAFPPWEAKSRRNMKEAKMPTPRTTWRQFCSGQISSSITISPIARKNFKNYELQISCSGKQVHVSDARLCLLIGITTFAFQAWNHMLPFVKLESIHNLGLSSECTSSLTS